MTNKPNSKQYDLESRTFKFASNIREFVHHIPQKLINHDDCKQLIRSSGSVGANYIEANESLSKKDFIMRIKICRKEAKESEYWLKLLTPNDQKLDKLRLTLIQEATELRKIFGSIVTKSQ